MTTSYITPLIAHERVAHLTGKVTDAYALGVEVNDLLARAYEHSF